MKHIGAGKDADAGAVAGPQGTRMRALGRGRLCLRGQPPVGLAGCFSGRGILESNVHLLLLLAENYNRTTKDLTTEAQSAQRTHRDYLLTMI
ncbi:MAG: hypothetical protein ACYDHX_01370 [Methanothrix sp.]